MKNIKGIRPRKKLVRNLLCSTGGTGVESLTSITATGSTVVDQMINSNGTDMRMRLAITILVHSNGDLLISLYIRQKR